jgi:ketosteroid isomerase-like protein
MSQENVEIARRAAVTWNDGDLEAFWALYHPDVEWDARNYSGWPEEPVYRGKEAVRKLLEEWRAIFSDYEFGVDRYVDLGERVLSICWQRGRGTGSGTPVLMEFAQVITVRDGLIVRNENYSDREEALEAVGLSE